MLPSAPFTYDEAPTDCAACGHTEPLRLVVYAADAGFAVAHACAGCGALENCTPFYATEEQALRARRHLDAFGVGLERIPGDCDSRPGLSP